MYSGIQAFGWVWGVCAAYNGVGLVYFFGTPLIEASPAMAFEMFNRSATLNSPDGQLNLASLYLTGTGAAETLDTKPWTLGFSLYRAWDFVHGRVQGRAESQTYLGKPFYGLRNI